MNGSNLLIQVACLIFLLHSCKINSDLTAVDQEQDLWYRIDSFNDYFLSNELLKEIPCYDPNIKDLKDSKPAQLDRYLKNCVRKECFKGNPLAIELTLEYLDFLGPQRLSYIRPELYRGEVLYDKFLTMLKSAKCGNEGFSPSSLAVSAIFEMIENIDGKTPREYMKLRMDDLFHQVYDETLCSSLNYINYYIYVLEVAKKENKIDLKEFGQN